VNLDHPSQVIGAVQLDLKLAEFVLEFRLKSVAEHLETLSNVGMLSCFYAWECEQPMVAVAAESFGWLLQFQINEVRQPFIQNLSKNVHSLCCRSSFFEIKVK